MCIPVFIISLILVVINVILYLMSQMTLGLMLLNVLKYLVLAYVLLVVTAIATLIIEKRSIKKMLKGIITYPIFMASWSLINFVCLFKRNTKWDKIEHVRNVDINEIN